MIYDVCWQPKAWHLAGWLGTFVGFLLVRDSTIPIACCTGSWHGGLSQVVLYLAAVAGLYYMVDSQWNVRIPIQHRGLLAMSEQIISWDFIKIIP